MILNNDFFSNMTTQLLYNLSKDMTSFCYKKKLNDSYKGNFRVLTKSQTTYLAQTLVGKI